MVKRWLLPIVGLSMLWASCEKEKEVEVNINPEVTVLTDMYGRKYYTGLTKPKEPFQKPIRSALDEMKKRKMKLPATWDWREKAKLSAIEDQGNCGSCWAFSTAATFQDVLIIRGGRRDMSEQYLLSCTKPNEWNCRNGGFFAHDMHMTPKGAVNASDYPYTASDSQCKSGLKYNEKLKSWAYVPGDDNPSVDEIKAAIYMYGPVGCGVAADQTFSNYRSGIFQGSGSTQLNHAVNIVGWGDGYWIMRNSWGTYWGENGWMRIKFGANGIGAQTNYIVYDKAPNPDPGPGPDPDPNPDPDPDPNPDPDPQPDPDDPDCEPQPVANTGFGPQVVVDIGSVMTLGTDQLDGHTYKWSAKPAFQGGAAPTAAKIKYFPTTTKTVSVTAKTKCGTSTASTKIVVRGVSLK